MNMSRPRHPLPVHRRALLAVRYHVNRIIETIRTPFIRPEVLLVAGGASPGKTAEVEARLQFLIEHVERPLSIRTVQRASVAEYLFSSAVASAEVTQFTKATRLALDWVADLDYERNAADGRHLIDIGVVMKRDKLRVTEQLAHETLTDRIGRLRANGRKPAYLFGTGPSLQKARDHSFDDGTTVVCNTIVRDAELWHHLKPAFLVAADSLYHFGFTPHARAFRADAVKRLVESEGRAMFAYPSRFDVIVRPEFREVEDLLLPIPFGNHTDVSVDLLSHYSLPKLGNILNILLLPMGCTISKDVRLWGFDGRAPKDVGFWSNSDKHSYPEYMQSIRDAHPAFFAEHVPKGNEEQYVKNIHGDLLDERLNEAEANGYRFTMLHETWTPTFQKRRRETLGDR